MSDNSDTNRRVTRSSAAAAAAAGTKRKSSPVVEEVTKEVKPSPRAPMELYFDVKLTRENAPLTYTRHSRKQCGVSAPLSRSPTRASRKSKKGAKRARRAPYKPIHVAAPVEQHKNEPDEEEKLEKAVEKSYDD